MHKVFHPRYDTDSVSRKEGGRGHLNIEDYVDATVQEPG